MRALFISPNEFRLGLGGSSNRMQQTHALLKDAGFSVEVLIVGPGEKSDVKIQVPKKCKGAADVKITQQFDLIFCNYLFLLERLLIQHPTRIVCDLHDDLIDRDERLDADWITRSEEEIKGLLRDYTPTVLHISPLEMKQYQRRYRAIDHIWLPFINPAIKYNISKSERRRFAFGFIGTQNSVNAQTLINIVELLDGHHSEFELFVAGPICAGITKAPSWMHLCGSIPLSEFYGKIGALLCPISNQTGASTKLIESLQHKIPILTQRRMLVRVGLIDVPCKGCEVPLREQIHACWSDDFSRTQQKMFRNYLKRYDVQKKLLLSHLNKVAARPAQVGPH